MHYYGSTKHIFFAVQKDGLHAERHFKNTILSNSLSDILHLLCERLTAALLGNAEFAFMKT